MTAIHQQRVILEAHSDQLDTIEHVLSRIQAELSRLVTLNIGGWTRTLETIRNVRSWLEDSVGDDGITHLRARSNDINGWCRMFDQVGSGDTVQQLAKWAESDDFREMSSPKGRDDASDWTECEKSDYAVGYTQSFNSMKVLFEFAAMRWLFFTTYDSAVFTSIQLYRGEMAEAYNSNMNRIAAIDTDATVRCVDSEFQCPSGYHKLANTIVDKMPCEMNSCICEGSPGQALRSRLCLEDGVTEGCSGDPPVGYLTEIVGGRKVLRRPRVVQPRDVQVRAPRVPVPNPWKTRLGRGLPGLPTRCYQIWQRRAALEGLLRWNMQDGESQSRRLTVQSNKPNDTWSWFDLCDRTRSVRPIVRERSRNDGRGLYAKVHH